MPHSNATRCCMFVNYTVLCLSCIAAMPPKKAQTSAPATSPKKGKATASASPAASTRSLRKANPSAEKAPDTTEKEAKVAKKPSPAKKTTTAQGTRGRSAKSPSPVKSSRDPTMPAANKSAAGRAGSKRPAPEDDAPGSPAKRGRGRPRKDATPVDEDDVMESIEEPTRRAPGRPRADTSRSRSKSAANRHRSGQDLEKQLQPLTDADDKPRQRSASLARRETPSDGSKLTPSRKRANTGMAQSGLSESMVRSSISARQHHLQTLDGDDESDTADVGEDNVVRAGNNDIRRGAPAQGKRASQQVSASAARGGPGGSSKKPSVSGTPIEAGNGSVTSFTNPENIPGDDHTTSYVDSQGRGPFKNPFHEKMPLKESWYRNMPPMFPFGETPYFEQKMSDQINADLSRSHEETLEAQKRQKGSGGLIGSISSSISSIGGGLVNTITGGPSTSPTKSTKKKTTVEALKKFTPWDLPEVDSDVIHSFARQSGIAA
ncbi:hypothetical protein CLAFUW4_01621 [Fulvia fulva]|uniref:Uncharacterized protein n=1 Tax=Passalora fulva TaxID=5499 RepID=A0A9Q8L687_PASFU|nr:uncharacterized protein CLAFUR5_01620 [Fulvia fulva]KAK4634496.1 hypothetical protein CLAFUR4_01619 [Fulvia fulva]KAK4637277.1 hypothetical protein CLAFUR0_01620 [Fulvia fulva]UJO11584.1 hypothetical protein CLAFUR5_01620 [Fulvia fulva]WPV08249.1 hypothetical protein CLAFUW4_01621 [Fulvia fulva]WPV23834.1 hypothetical protein CLAFUW7_01623 [Fulvia fulva]